MEFCIEDHLVMAMQREMMERELLFIGGEVEKGRREAAAARREVGGGK